MCKKMPDFVIQFKLHMCRCGIVHHEQRLKIIVNPDGSDALTFFFFFLISVIIQYYSDGMQCSVHVFKILMARGSMKVFQQT